MSVVKIWSTKAASQPGASGFGTSCTLEPIRFTTNTPGTFSTAYWLSSDISKQLGLPLKVSNLSTENEQILVSACKFSSFRCKINNDTAVLNRVANRLFTSLDANSTSFGEAWGWKFWDTAVIARADGKDLDIEYVHAMDYFLRGKIKEIKEHGPTFATAKQRHEYYRAIKDSSFTAQNMAAEWEAIKADGVAKGYEKYESMGNPFMQTDEKKKSVDGSGGKEVPRACEHCGGYSFRLRACGGCGEVWYCGSACEGGDREAHQEVCGAMDVDG